jgi:hypothetical protein
MQRHGLRPASILWEVQEAYQPGVVKEKLSRGPLEYTALWKAAAAADRRPVKFGAICAPALASMLWDEYYKDDRALINDLCDIMNAEFRELRRRAVRSSRSRSRRITAARRAGLHRRRSRVPDRGVQPPARRASTRRSGCTRAGAIPNQQRVYWEPPSYERALPICCSSTAT